MNDRDDRREIHDVVLTYCRGVDRGDLDLVRSVYHPDALDHHHTAFDGTVDEFIDWIGHKKSFNQKKILIKSSLDHCFRS